jgi:hypothetical protein
MDQVVLLKQCEVNLLKHFTQSISPFNNGDIAVIGGVAAKGGPR